MTSDTPLARPALAAMELFAGLSSQALDEVMAHARLRYLAKDTRIFDQGDPAERAYALIEGAVRISQSGADGGEVLVRLIGPGEMFGTAAIFTDREYPGDATTIIGSLEISWSEAELFQLMERHARIAVNVIGILGKRLKEMQERMRELSTQRAEQRVAHSILRLIHQAGRSTASGTAIEFPLRRKDIADISGTTLHTASRILTTWEEAGLLVSDKQRLTVCRPAAIQKIADGLSS